jgi:predicted nucleic acid-binding protein
MGSPDGYLIDTAAVIALNHPTDQFHEEAVRFFSEQNCRDYDWFSLRVTSHEAFTTTRYSEGLSPALQNYDFLRSPPFVILDFCTDDELEARSLIERHPDQTYSFHDSLCAAVMKRVGTPNVFTFDRHFWAMGLGFTVLPGLT